MNRMLPEERFMYIGPTIEPVAIHNTIYAGPTDAIDAAVQLRPYLSGLCIEISELPEAMKQIRAREGRYYTLYRRAVRDARKIAKGEI